MESYQSTWNAGSAMRAGIALFISWGLLITVSPAEEIRDYYAEPGLNPFKETVNQNFHEHIDPFSGTLQLKYTDLIVPGNGGMDIGIHRVYTSLQEWELGVRRASGVGWTMHFGRRARRIRSATNRAGRSRYVTIPRSNYPMEAGNSWS